MFGVHGQQLLTESQIFKDEQLSGTESTDNPSEEMSEQRDESQDHVRILPKLTASDPTPSHSFCKYTKF